MTQMNRKSFVLAGLAAGAVMSAVTLLMSGLYVEEMFAILKDHDFSPPRGVAPMAVFFLMRFTWGFVAVWFYAASRSRFGPGPKTAIGVGVMLWLGGALMAVVSYGMLGLFPMPMLGLWAVITLVGLVLSTLMGAWIYREV